MLARGVCAFMKLLNFTSPPNLLSSHQTAEFAEFIRTPNLSSSSDRRFHITMTVNGKTALMYAAMNGHTDTVNALAGTHGANVDAVDHGGQTALMSCRLARPHGHRELAGRDARCPRGCCQQRWQEDDDGCRRRWLHDLCQRPVTGRYSACPAGSVIGLKLIQV